MNAGDCWKPRGAASRWASVDFITVLTDLPKKRFVGHDQIPYEEPVEFHPASPWIRRTSDPRERVRDCSGYEERSTAVWPGERIEPATPDAAEVAPTHERCRVRRRSSRKEPWKCLSLAACSLAACLICCGSQLLHAPLRACNDNSNLTAPVSKFSISLRLPPAEMMMEPGPGRGWSWAGRDDQRAGAAAVPDAGFADGVQEPRRHVGDLGRRPAGARSIQNR